MGAHMFFFEKKNQKTFMRAVADYPASTRQGPKVFLLLFFQKKKVLPSLSRERVPSYDPA
jgi:hypothetical protein